MIGRALLVLAALAGAPTATAGDAPMLESDSEIATAGFFRLNWSGAPMEASYELQEATRADFADSRLFYRGPDLATVLSGKPDGSYYYRVRFIDREEASAWSEPVHVLVKSHPLARALTFLALGAIVFVATVLLIVRGEAHAR